MEYLEFYKLKEDPFGITPDPDFFYPSKWHTEALQSMDYLIKKGEGFMLLTGDPGTGKTTLIRRFLNSLDSKIAPVVIYNSTLNPSELLKYIVKSMTKRKTLSETEDKVRLSDLLCKELMRRKKEGIKNLVIIDEAQDLPEETLTELKHLSNIETDKEKLIHFILLAQPYFEDKLSKPEYSQLNQRITLRVRLYHFDKEEVDSYIKFRIQRAGDVPISFEKGAIKKIYKASRGIPRLINLICSRALMVGYLESSYLIKKSYVNSAIEHLNLK